MTTKTEEMTIYQRCSQACRELAEAGKPFIDIDVVTRALGDDWTAEDEREARKHANQVCGVAYRTHKVVRFGVVVYEGEKDYVRKAGRILYSGVESGIEQMKTANGTYKAIKEYEDKLASVGRRKYSERDDFEPWDEQGFGAITPATVDLINPKLKRRLEKVREQNTDLESEVATLRAEVKRLRGEGADDEHFTQMIELLQSMNDRVTTVEGQVATMLDWHERLGTPLSVAS